MSAAAKKNVGKEKPMDEWTHLMSLAQKGDKRAYAQLLKEVHPYLRNVLSHKISQSGAVEDVVQEIMISVHKSMNTYSPDRPFKPWLHAIMSYRLADYFRSHYKKQEFASEHIDTLDYSEFSDKFVTESKHAGEYKDIEAALETLSKRQRQLFEMMKIQGHTAKEVSDETGMSVSAVKVSVHRTSQKLKEILQG